jgi:chemotaxis protein CheX
MKLAANLDLAAARPLAAELSSALGRPLSIDASDVERLGGVCLQLLLAASAQWERDGVAFSVAEQSPAFRDCVRLMAAPALAAEGSL